MVLMLQKIVQHVKDLRPQPDGGPAGAGYRAGYRGHSRRRRNAYDEPPSGAGSVLARCGAAAVVSASETIRVYQKDVAHTSQGSRRENAR